MCCEGRGHLWDRREGTEAEAVKFKDGVKRREGRKHTKGRKNTEDTTSRGGRRMSAERERSAGGPASWPA